MEVEKTGVWRFLSASASRVCVPGCRKTWLIVSVSLATTRGRTGPGSCRVHVMLFVTCAPVDNRVEIEKSTGTSVQA